MRHGLAWLGRRGQYCLIAGLLIGLALPGAAEALRPWIGSLIVVLLVVTGMRVGARAAFGSLGDIKGTLLRIGSLQLLLPLVAFGVFASLGLISLPIAIAVTLMLSAPSVTGAPNFAIMIGQDPAAGMRILVLGTMFFPITALPALVFLDLAESGISGALTLSLNLLVSILGAVGLGFLVRRALPILGEARARGSLDGIAALLLGVVVVGLMSAVGPLLRTDPLSLMMWVSGVIAINFGLVVGTLALLNRLGTRFPAATAIYAGNRNIALYLIVLPESVAAPLLLFIGSYQIPMYLTPFLLSRLRMVS